MPDYRVTARRRRVDDEQYDRMLDMLEADHRLAPINPGDDSRTYVIAAADRQDSTRVLARLLEGMHFGEWPDHIAKFEAESL